MRGLAGKVSVLAGGAGGIGTATATRLAEEGVSVVIGDVNGAEAAEIADRINSGGGRAVGCGSDITDEEQVRDLVARAVKEFGQLDIFHANAADLSPGTIRRDSDAVTIPLEVFDRTIEVGLRGHLIGARHAIPELLNQGGGALVFTSSVTAYFGEAERPAYAIAKSGITALVRHIASRWGAEGIRANAVAPGLVLTPTNRDMLIPALPGHPLRSTRSTRQGTPEDIAALVAFLASGDAEWINGQVISIDGGLMMR